MKKYASMISITIYLMCVSLSVNAQSNASAFAGFWVLDHDKTTLKKGFLDALKDYKMLVAEDQDRLMVKSQVVGQTEVRSEQQRSSNVRTNTGSRTSAPSPNGVMSTTTDSSSAAGKISYGGSMAIFFTPPEITYDLTGKEIKIEPNAGDRLNGTTRIKAKVAKDGKSVELTTFRMMKTGQGIVEITLRETWKLSPDGQSMRFHRSAESPVWRDDLDLVLVKQAQ